MKFIKAATTAPVASGGSSGIPSWRRKWIEEQVRQVELECGCIEDLSIPALTFINTFEGTSIDCVKHDRFSTVVRTVKKKATKYPAEPLF